MLHGAALWERVPLFLPPPPSRAPRKPQPAASGCCVPGARLGGGSRNNGTLSRLHLRPALSTHRSQSLLQPNPLHLYFSFPPKSRLNKPTQPNPCTWEATACSTGCISDQLAASRRLSVLAAAYSVVPCSSSSSASVQDSGECDLCMQVFNDALSLL